MSDDQLTTQRLAGYLLCRIGDLETELLSCVANPSAAARAQAIVSELRASAEEAVQSYRGALEARVKALEDGARSKPQQGNSARGKP